MNNLLASIHFPPGDNRVCGMIWSPATKGPTSSDSCATMWVPENKNCIFFIEFLAISNPGYSTFNNHENINNLTEKDKQPLPWSAVIKFIYSFMRNPIDRPIYCIPHRSETITSVEKKERKKMF